MATAGRMIDDSEGTGSMAHGTLLSLAARQVAAAVRLGGNPSFTTTFDVPAHRHSKKCTGTIHGYTPSLGQSSTHTSGDTWRMGVARWCSKHRQSRSLQHLSSSRSTHGQMLVTL